MLLTDSKKDTFWSLEGILLDNKKWFIPINRQPFRIGRSEDCHLTLSCNTISRHHAEIIYENGQLLINDLNSANGTFLNNKKVMSKTLIRKGDIIHFDELEFRVTLNNISDCTSGRKTQKGSEITDKKLPKHFVNTL